MTLYQMFDASSPPPTPYPGSHAVAGYLGGNTPHIWEVPEWDRFAGLVQFGIWVGAAEGDPVGHGNAAVQAAHNLGWRPNAPLRRAIICDIETEQNRPWVDAFGKAVWDGGFQTYVYGSASTILGDPAKEGRWIALYNDEPNIPAIPAAVGHQYKANVPWDGTFVDLSVITAEMLAHGGTGPRH